MKHRHHAPFGASLLLVASVVVTGCPGDDGASAETGSDAEPFFPEDYAGSYVEVRDCRGSGDHDLNNIRILVDTLAQGPYEDRSGPFPEGAVVLKEEYDFGDTACAGPIKQWTVMRKLASGTSPDTLDWSWQQVDPDRQVLAEDLPRCTSCHTGCGNPPDGHDGTCSIPDP